MKTVIVTGASGGIGSAIAGKFAENGWFVFSIYKSNASAAKRLFEAIRESGGNCCIYKADISKPDQVKKAVEQAVSETGTVDAVVNCAGTALIKPLSDTSDEEIRNVIETDLSGTVFCSREAARVMIKNHSGSIINISSMWGVTGASCETVYSAAKAGVIGFTRALASELAPSGIRVNCVSPGYIETDMNSSLDQAAKEEIIRSTPLGRAGASSDVAETVFFLAGDGASFITGQNIVVDGGFTL